MFEQISFYDTQIQDLHDNQKMCFTEIDGNKNVTGKGFRILRASHITCAMQDVYGILGIIVTYYKVPALLNQYKRVPLTVRLLLAPTQDISRAVESAS